MGLTKLKSRWQQGCHPPGSPCLFPLLEVAYLPWLLAPSIFIHGLTRVSPGQGPERTMATIIATKGPFSGEAPACRIIGPANYTPIPTRACQFQWRHGATHKLSLLQTTFLTAAVAPACAPWQAAPPSPLCWHAGRLSEAGDIRAKSWAKPIRPMNTYLLQVSACYLLGAPGRGLHHLCCCPHASSVGLCGPPRPGVSWVPWSHASLSLHSSDHTAWVSRAPFVPPRLHMCMSMTTTFQQGAAWSLEERMLFVFEYSGRGTTYWFNIFIHHAMLMSVAAIYHQTALLQYQLGTSWNMWGKFSPAAPVLSVPDISPKTPESKC